ncbi:MAG TPA: ABC transporter substrate-binding protein [Ktedonobacteraceae bacterium]|jgi:peptide/nickel transport system substrate-binding protein|nr:ABC transporter substrate-binding protein [Ktedonobacteraceae bacterium]
MAPLFTPENKKGRVKLIAGVCSLLVLFTLLLSACGGSNSTPSGAKKSVLKVAAQSYDFAQSGFNPYNGHPNAGMLGLVYETLYFVNVNGGQFTPMLATSYQWNSDNTQVTFAIRQGVKWNDGQPFSADDVAFTFNMMKQYPAADSGGVWSFLKSVTAPDANTVVMTFQKAYPPVLTTIAGHVYIVPKHVFSSVGDPTKYLTSKPVGTGPFVLTRFQTDLAVYDKNPGYWQAAQVKVDEVRFPEYKDNATLQLALPKGDIDWAGYFSPTLQQDFLAKDPAHYHVFMDAVNLYSICPNQKDPVIGGQAGLPVRLALSAALDRSAIAAQATAGLEPAGSITGLVLPTAKDWVDPQYASLPSTADVAKAEKYLTDAGFKKGSDGIYAKNGKRLSLTLRSVDVYSDWNAAAKLIADQAKAVGIEVKNVTVGEDNYYTLRTDGKYDYQLMFCGMVGGPTPYYLYNQYLNSTQIGEGKTNFMAWNDPTTDKYLNQYASTTDQAAQKQAIQGIEKVFVENQPFIPLWTGADYDEYSTKNFTGWPDETNPYSSGSPNTSPDLEQVVLHLQPVA